MPQTITIKKTVKATVTGVSGSIDLQNTNPAYVRVFSDRSVHVRIGAEATTDEGMPLNAAHPEFLDIPSGKTINFILAAGETDGNIWVTVV